MPRLTKSNPKYRRHKASDRAFVELDGKRIYLGAYNSPESRVKYNRLVGEYLLADRSAPPSLKDEASSLLITELCIGYIRWARIYYQKGGRPTAEYHLVKTVLKRFRAECGHFNAADFGPLKFKDFRQKLIDAGLTRVTVNHYMRHVLALFRSAAENEKLPGKVWQDLKAVPPLRKNRSEAKEKPAIPPASEEAIEKLLPFLPKMLADMVQIQLHTVARPGELVQMRPMDIIKTGDDWIYRPATHKTEHHGFERIIAIGPQAQALLAPYLDRAPESYCFSPKELMEQRRRARVCGNAGASEYNNRQRPNRKGAKRAPGDRFTRDSYYNAIRRACRKPECVQAGIEPFNPNQLRKRGATKVRKETDLESAQVILGHKSKTTTERFYAEAPVLKALEVMRRLG
jgi:integrase